MVVLQRIIGSLLVIGWMVSTNLAYAQLADPSAGLFINEIFFDPPSGDSDGEREFIELRGTPNASLENHFLIFLESENSTDPEGPGGVDNIFDLGDFSFGSNGFLSLRQAGSQHTVVNPAATNVINTSPNLPPFGTQSAGFGSGPGSFSVSTIGASDDGDDGNLENGGFSALLIRNDTGVDISLSDDFDADDDGNLDPFVFDNFTILDSVGQAEPGETDPFFYAAINFANTDAVGGASVTAGGEVVFLPFEIEYLGRFGNSTGVTNADYLVTNLTSDSNSGAGNLPGLDIRVSTQDPQPASGSDTDGDGVVDTPPGPLASGGVTPGDVEANQDIPFGLPILNTIGGPNFLSGDFNDDGTVSAADFTVFRDTFGATADEANPQPADHDRSFVVDNADFELFQSFFGFGAASAHSASSPVLTSPSLAIPEPQSAVLMLMALASLAARSVKRS